MAAVREFLRRSASALLGVSAYEQNDQIAGGPSEEQVDRIRRTQGGSIQRRPTTRPRWYLSDLESAEWTADSGDLSWAAQLMTAARKDGVVSGVLSTRTSGLVRLPKRFRGDPDVIAALELGHDRIRSVFDEIVPATELSQFSADGVLLGVAIGELVPVEGRDYPVFVRLNPEFLRWRWTESRWYFESVAGLIPITPGDGRWVLHTPGGRSSPWQNGLWRAIGRAYIRKEHASLMKDEWEAKLANPARVAVAPAGGVEAQKQSFFRQVMDWGVNTVFGLTPGYDVRLLESNGRGYESFIKTIAAQDQEITICIAGQVVTTTGGTGFANADVHKSIRADLIKDTADALAYTLNTQVIPAFIMQRWGEDALASKAAVVEWDVTPPKDRTAEATSLNTFGQALTSVREALAPYGHQVDVVALCSRFGVPLVGDADANGIPDVVDASDEGGNDAERPALSLVENEADNEDDAEAA